MRTPIFLLWLWAGLMPTVAWADDPLTPESSVAQPSSLQPRATPAPTLVADRKIQLLQLSLYAINTQERITNLPAFYTKSDQPGRLFMHERARRQLEQFARDPKTEQVKRGMPESLWLMLYLVSYHFDQPIELISGYRSRDRRTSRHRQGKAIDFRIPGVSAREVFEYIRTRFISRGIGLGLYPTSNFLHLDVRDQSYIWIDDSGPGRRARYRSGVVQPGP